MPPRKVIRLSSGSYYAPLPMFCIGLDETLCDFNLAAQLLLAPTVETGRGQTIQAFLDNCVGIWERAFFAPAATVLNNANANTNAAVAAKAFHASGEPRRCHGGAYGNFTLTPMAIGAMNYETGALRGITLYWELNWDADNIEGQKAFISDFAKKVGHQLTWDSYAVSYDKVLLKMDYYKEVVQRHVTALSGPAPREILDLGAGTGNVSAPLVRLGHEVTAIDLNRSMLERLPGKLSSEELERLVIHHQDGERLGKERFDGVNILLVLFDMANPRFGLDEAIRVLKPGGTLAITEPKSCFNLQALLNKVEDSLHQQNLFDQLYGDWQRVSRANHSINPKVREDRLWIEDIAELLQQRGFLFDGPKDSHFGNCATIIATKPL